MSSYHEIAKDILLKAIDSGLIPKAPPAESTYDQVLERNLESISKAYKEIFKVVSNPSE